MMHCDCIVLDHVLALDIVASSWRLLLAATLHVIVNSCIQ